MLYGRIARGNPVEAINWRLVASAPTPDVSLHRSPESTAVGSVEEAKKGTRSIYLPEAEDYVSVPVYDRYRIAPRAAFNGPAIVEERESTVVVGPGASIAVDELLNLVITMPS